MTSIFTVGVTARFVCRRRLAFVIGVAMLLGWPLHPSGRATAQGILRTGTSFPPCGDTTFFPPCDTASGATQHQIPVPPRARSGPAQLGLGARTQGPTVVVGPGIWDGAQLEVVTTDPRWVGRPYAPGRAIATDSKGRVYLLYIRVRPGPDSLFFRFRDPGQTWSDETSLPVTPHQTPHAGLTVSPKDDQPEFFFVDGGYYQPSYIVHGTYDFMGNAWALDTIALSTEDDWSEGQTFSFDVDTLGGLHVAWSDPGWNEELQKTIDQIWYADNTSGVWRKQRIADLGAGGYVRVDPSGRAYIVYLVRRDNHNFSIVAANHFRGDTVWTADSTDTSPTTFGMAGFVVGRDGTQHALFYGRPCYSGCFDNYELFYTKRASGGPWGPLEFIADTTTGGYLKVDCGGDAQVMLGRYSYGGFLISTYYATNASGPWSSREMEFSGFPFPSVATSYHDYTLDWYDRGHIVMTADTNFDNVWEFYHYAAPTVALDVIDVMSAIDVVYLGRAGRCDPLRYDLDCDSHVDVADVWRVIDYVFMNGPSGCRF